MSMPDHPVSLVRVRAAVAILGLLVLGFIWGMHQQHNRHAHAERLRTEAAEHLNLVTAPTPALDEFIQSQRAVAIVPVDHRVYEPLLPLLFD